jgi:hypothetical protein
MGEITKMSEELEHAMKNDASLRAKAAGFVRRLALFRDKGYVAGIGTAPYYIIVAERRGFPPVELQSLAHCLENMWLKATALGLGFQIVSVTSQMSSNPAFCAIIGIPPGEWELMGCAVGYAADELSPSIRPPVEAVTAWLPWAGNPAYLVPVALCAFPIHTAQISGVTVWYSSTASPKGQEAIRNYLASPEGQKTLDTFLSTPEGQETAELVLCRALEGTNLSADVRAMVLGALAEKKKPVS